MKHAKILLAAAACLVATASMAQDLNSPQYAKWGSTLEEKQQNILNSNFLKESCDNRDYDAAARYLNALIKSCPEASSAIYQRGAIVYKNKINRAKSLAEKNAYVDSLMLMYDLRAKYFGDNPKQGTAYILDRKAREYVIYRPADRAGIRKFFREAIEAGGENVDPETVALYFGNLCEDYKTTDEVMPDEVISEYDRLSPIFENNPDAIESKNQCDAACGLSGAANGENLGKLFSSKLEANPEDEAVLAQAVSLMSRANCDGEFFFTTAEKHYTVHPTSETALSLAQVFQNKGEYDKAIKYLNEALAAETDNAEREKLLVRISLVDMVANNFSGAAAAARQVRELNPENGLSYFVLAQCYAASAASCGGFAGQAAFWAAYDTMSQAVSLLQNNPEYLDTAKSALSAYRGHFPTSEECFFNELQEGARYTVTCGTAAGVGTTVRAR